MVADSGTSGNIFDQLVHSWTSPIDIQKRNLFRDIFSFCSASNSLVLFKTNLGESIPAVSGLEAAACSERFTLEPSIVLEGSLSSMAAAASMSLILRSRASSRVKSTVCVASSSRILASLSVSFFSENRKATSVQLSFAGTSYKTQPCYLTNGHTM